MSCVDANTRWIDAMREIRFRGAAASSIIQPNTETTSRDRARRNWRRVAVIVRHACHDQDQNLASQEGHSSMYEQVDYQPIKSKAMGLNYFLEMIDIPKHRYAANLRAYHERWVEDPDTPQNFFAWLDDDCIDHDELQNCDRKRLDSERVRYLSREERLRYLVAVDDEGRLCWASSGDRITTSIVHVDSSEDCISRQDESRRSISKEKMNRPSSSTQGQEDSRPLIEKSISPIINRPDSSSTTKPLLSAHRPPRTTKLPIKNNEKKSHRTRHFSLSILLNQILQLAVPRNAWIFIADPFLNLYINRKQFGGFQHSSFLSGSCALAAGVIKVEDGQLLRLTPLSGHYRPTTKEFREFEKRLEYEVGVDMSCTRTSWALIVLGGLEGYLGVKRDVGKVSRLVRREARWVTTHLH